jgi:hypothetical protein
MAQQVLYNTTTGQVIQWQDTNQYTYPELPAGAAILAVTEAEWANQAGIWYVSSGALTQTNPNPNTPTLAQLQAQATAQVDMWLTQQLAPTDWIITKINEYNILGKQNTFTTQYATQLNQRQTYRQTAQTVKQQITAATTQAAIQTALAGLT